jgi:hypothetical protein
LPRVDASSFVRGSRVQYIGAPTSHRVVTMGDIGWVTKVEADQVFVAWPRRGIHAVAAGSVRVLEPVVNREVKEGPNRRIWALLGERLPPLSNGRPRDPYMEQGCHPDIVGRLWDDLGKELPADCRAQANGRPVLAHPETDRIFALSRGTAYALWLTHEDFLDALDAGARTRMNWSGGSVTDLERSAGSGWIWGARFENEPHWVRHAYAAVGVPGAER